MSIASVTVLAITDYFLTEEGFLPNLKIRKAVGALHLNKELVPRQKGLIAKGPTTRSTSYDSGKQELTSTFRAQLILGII